MHQNSDLFVVDLQNFNQKLKNVIPKILTIIKKCLNNLSPNKIPWNHYLKYIELDNEVLVLSIGKNALINVNSFIKYCNKINVKLKKIFIFQAKNYFHTITVPINSYLFELDHPYPNLDTFKKTKQFLNLTGNLDEKIPLIILVSGGGSSVFALPEKNISYETYITLISKMIKYGQDIESLNYLRVVLDKIKGGKLLKYFKGRPILGLYFSDILSDDPFFIGSGPSVFDKTKLIAMKNSLTKSASFLNYNLEELIKIYEDDIQEIQQLYSYSKSSINNYIIRKRSNLSQFLIEELSAFFETRIYDDALKGNLFELRDFFLNLVKQLELVKQNSCFIITGEITLPIENAYEREGGRLSSLMVFLSEIIENYKDIFVVGFASDGKDGSSVHSGYIIDSNSFSKIKGRLETRNTDIKEIILNGQTGKILGDCGFTFDIGITNINLLDFVLFFNLRSYSSD